MKTERIGAALALLLGIASAGCKGGPPPADTPPKDAAASGASSGGDVSRKDAAQSTSTGPASTGTASTDTLGSGSASTGSGVARLELGVCEAISRQVGGKLQSIRDKNVACKTAHDCEIISSGMCNLSVGCGLAVSLGKGREVERLSEEATRDQCKTWNEGGCPTTMAMPIPSCPQMSPICQGGRCSQIPATR